METTNAKRFINAFNKLDKALRAQFDIRPSSSFVEVIRRSASLSPIIRKYEDDLLDYGRLRNAIVHKSESDMVIAEPHLDVVEQLEHIADIVSTPPRADKTIAKKALFFDESVSLATAIKTMAELDYSNVPVVSNGGIIGVVNHKQIVEGLAKADASGKSLQEFILSAKISDILSQSKNHYIVAKSSITLDNVLNEYYKNAKLQIIVLTANGSTNSDILGVITTGDIVTINKILDDYQ